MRLTALCVCGTLLAFSSLFWITADSDEGVLLVDTGFGPCTVTLMPEGPCRQVQDESTCPYLLTLPPLTIHLPQQFRELEKIVEDLQKLKDSVDELREMCADCTVSQTERECGRQRERERETLNEGTDRHEDELNWVNGFKKECSTGGVKMEGNVDSKKSVTLEEKERKDGETERESNEGVVKQNEEAETLKEVLETGGKTQPDRAKGKDKVGHTKVTNGGRNDRIVGEKVTDKNNREAERDRKKDTAGKGNAKGYQENKLEHGKERTSSTNVKNKEKTEESGHHVWQDKTKETETQTKVSDRIKMSKDHDENTNQEQEQNREERKKEMERRVKVEKNNEELKETERTGHIEKEETIKVGVEGRETGTEIKTEDEDMESGEGDSDGESPSSKTTKRTDFVSISPTPHPTISIASRLDSVDLNEAVSSIPSPPLPSSTLHYITDVHHEITTQNTGLRTAGISKPSKLDAGSETATTMSTVSGKNIISLTTASRLTPRKGLQGHIISTTTTTTTTTHHQDLTAFPEATDDSRVTAKNNISSNTKTGMKTLTGQGPKQADELKPKLKPEADQVLKNPRTDQKPDRAPLSDKKTKYDQKHQPSHHKPTTSQRPKPAKDPKQVEMSKPKQKTPPENIPTDQNLKNHSGQDHTPEQNKSPIQKPKSQEKTVTPFQRPALHQRPQDANTTRSDEYPVIDQEHKSYQVPGTNQTSKATKMQKTNKQPKSEQKTKTNPGQVPESKQSQAASFTEKPDQKEKFDEGSSHASNSNQDSTPEKNPIPNLPKIRPNQKPQTSQNLPGKPKPNQKHPKPGTNVKPKPNVKPNTDRKPPQTNGNLKRPNPGQMPNLNAKGAPQEESNRTPKPRPPSFYGLPTKSPVRPGATPIHRPKPAVQPKPSPKTKTDPFQISQNISGYIQTSKTNMPLTSGPAKHTAEVTLSPGNTEFNPSVRKTVTPHPKTSISLENGAFPHFHTLPEDSTLSPNSRIVSDLRPQTAHQPPLLPVTTKPNKIIHRILPSVIPSITPGSTQSNIIPKSDFGTQAKKHHDMEIMAPAFSTAPPPISHSISTPSPDIRLTTATDSGTKLPKVPADLPHLPKTPPNQKPKTSQNIPGKPKPNQKHPKPGTNVKPKPNVKPNTGRKPPQTNGNLKRPNPGQMPNPNAKGAPQEEFNSTPKPRPPSFYGLPTKSPVRPGATPIHRPKPAVQPKPSPKTKTDPSQISQNISDYIQTSQTSKPLTSDPTKHTAEVAHSLGYTEFNPSARKTVTPHPKPSNSLENGAFPHFHTLSEDSTKSPNSRIVSDLRPQTAHQPPLLPVTTKPNKIIHRILPSVIPSITPGSTQSNIIPKSDFGTQAKKHHDMEIMAPAFSTTPSYISHSVSTPSPDIKSTTATAPGPELPKVPADLPHLPKTPPNQKPKTSQNIPGKPKPVPKPNQKHPKPGTNVKPKPNVKPNTGRKPPQTNGNLKKSKPGQVPNLNAKSVSQEESNRTPKPRPPSFYGLPTKSPVRPGETPIQRPKPAVQPKPSPKTKTDPSQISQNISGYIQTSKTNMPLTSGPAKHTAEVTLPPGDTEFNPRTRKTVTPHPKTSSSLENGAFPHFHTLPEDSTMSPNSRIVPDLRPQTARQPPSRPVTTRPNVMPSTSPGSTQSNIIPKSDFGTQAKKHHNMEKMAPAFSTTPSPIYHSIATPSPDFKSTTAANPGPELPKVPADLPDLPKTPPKQKPKNNQNIPGKPKPMPKPNQKHPKPGTNFKPKPNVKPNTDRKPPQTNGNLKRPNPGQTPNLNAKGAPQVESNRTSKPRFPSLSRSPTMSPVRPGAKSFQSPKPAVQRNPSPKTKTDPSQISWTVSDHLPTSQTNTPFTSGPTKHTTEVTHSLRETEFNLSVRKTVTPHPKTSNSLEKGAVPHLHTLPEDSTLSPNSRIVSDLRPQTASEPPSLPMTTRPNKIIHRILPSVIPSTSPGSTQSNIIPKSDSGTQVKKHHNMEKTATSPISHSIVTPSPDIRSTTATTPGPELPKLAAEASTPSARELRVKINQVAAFFNNSLSTNGRPPNMHHKEYSEENQGGSRPDGTNGKLPTVKLPKVTMLPRDCSDHLIRGQTESGRYLVTPDPRAKSFLVYCDMQQEGGGWTVLQRRQDGSVSFNRTWAEYQSGFGELDEGEFWLGNNMIHRLTRDREMVLRVELEDFDRMTGYAQYEQFRVASERLRYKLTVGGYSGTAGDALHFSKKYDHNNRAFTTPDRDHDRYPSGNCGAYYSSGWWFDACMSANLNGRYYVGRYKGVRDGIFWGTWYNIISEYYPTNDRQSFKRVRMMIRPKGFAP